MITLLGHVYRAVSLDGQITVIKRSSARQWRLCPEMTARVLAGLRVCPLRVVT